VIEVYRDTSALSEGAPLYHPPHAEKAYSAAARRTADLALAAIRSRFWFRGLNFLIREHVGTSFRRTLPYPQIYPHCGYAVNDFTRTSLDDIFTIFPYFPGFYGRLWTFLEERLVRKEDSNP